MRVTKTKISLNLPQGQLFALKKRVLQEEELSIRQLSAYVDWTIQELFKQKNWMEWCILGSKFRDKLNIKKSFSLNGKTNDLLNESVIKLRHKYPEIEGNKGVIIRAAITWVLSPSNFRSPEIL